MNDFRANLRTRIYERIKVRGYCVVYNNDLSGFSAPLPDCRKHQIRDIQSFAAKNSLVVMIRDTGLNATFTVKKETKVTKTRPERLSKFS
jgi:hypothetical protein